MGKAKLSDRETQVRFARFVAVGGGSLLVQLGVIRLLRGQVAENIAFSISWLVSTATHYAANRFWALPSARRDSGRQFAEYLFAVALSYLINFAAFRGCRELLGMSVAWSVVCAVPPSTMVVFLLLNYRVFRPGKT